MHRFRYRYIYFPGINAYSLSSLLSLFPPLYVSSAVITFISFFLWFTSIVSCILCLIFLSLSLSLPLLYSVPCFVPYVSFPPFSSSFLSLISYSSCSSPSFLLPIFREFRDILSGDFFEKEYNKFSFIETAKIIHFLQLISESSIGRRWKINED